MRPTKLAAVVLGPASVLGLAWLLACGGTQKRSDGGEGPLPEGAVAPEVVGTDVKHAAVKVSERRGHPVVVYFYPKDGTPGCTKEACAFRDAWAKYQAAEVAVIGVSTNSPERHQQFLEEEHLPIALAADESGDVARAYGVAKGLFGYSRITFLVGPDGRIAKRWLDVDPGVHAAEVLAAALASAPPATP
jgi:peroxiredoxin Q/BCP